MRDSLVINYFVLLLPVLLLVAGIWWLFTIQLPSTMLFYMLFPAAVVAAVKLPYMILKMAGIDMGLLRFLGNVLVILCVLLIPFASYNAAKIFMWHFLESALMGFFSTVFYLNAAIFMFSLEELKNANIINTFFTTWGVFSEITSIIGVIGFSLASFFLGVVGWAVARFVF